MKWESGLPTPLLRVKRENTSFRWKYPHGSLVETYGVTLLFPFHGQKRTLRKHGWKLWEVISKLSCKRGESQFPRLKWPQLAVGKSNIGFWFYVGLKSKSIPRRLWLGSNYNSGWFGKNSKQIPRIRLNKKKKAVFDKIDIIYSFYMHLNVACIKSLIHKNHWLYWLLLFSWRIHVILL